MITVKDVIYTIFERENLLKFLDQFDQIVFNSSIDVKSFIEENFPDIFDVSRKKIILEAIHNGEGNPDQLFSQSKAVREELKDMPVVTLTLPFRPDQNYSTEIAKRVREVAGTPVVVEILTDVTILGGAVIENSGKVGEYSFRHYFDKLLKRKEEFHGF